MTDFLELLTRFALSALGLTALPDLAAIGLAIALLAMTALIVAVTIGVVHVGGGSAAHPLRAIDVGVLLPQSDPDAAGHPRPRAPGVVRAV
ncbi:DUF6412 domain-containing protein [Microbacterium sp. NPDC055903]